MEKKQLRVVIILVIIILILFVGWGLGVVSQRQVVSQQVKNESAKILGSKVISSVSAFGTITKIQDRNITLSSSSDSLTVFMPASARVYSFTLISGGKNSSQTPTQKIVTFGDIKIGDSVNANLRLLPNGQFEGVSVVILPSQLK